MSANRLITGWVDLELAVLHMQSFGNEKIEAAHWLRIAGLNIGAAADSNEVLIKIAAAVGELADKYEIVLFNTHASEKALGNVIADVLPKAKEIKKNLRIEIDTMHEAPRA